MTSRQLTYYHDNKEEQLQHRQQRRQDPSWKEKQAAYQRQYYAANRAKVKERVKERRKMRLYGLTEDEYQAMLGVQDGRCAMCGQSMKRPHVDHDHETGKVRGLLCKGCNTGLGQFNDSIDSLLDAVAYLQRVT